MDSASGGERDVGALDSATRLAEIEARHNVEGADKVVALMADMSVMCNMHDDVLWLIGRVKELEAENERLRNGIDITGSGTYQAS